MPVSEPAPLVAPAHPRARTKTHILANAGNLIGQIKNTRSHVQCCLSAGCASNKQQCISLRCPMIRQPRHPNGRQTAKLALFRDVLRFRSGVSDHHRQSQSRKDWWSQTGSNRRHPACKAGALPAELWPHYWWARVDSNYRPHAYQACALTT